MAKLATTPHPYYPDSWFSKEQASAFLAEHGYTPRLTMAWCQANAIEVASTGHIRLLCLEQYVSRRRSEEEQDRLPIHSIQEQAVQQEIGEIRALIERSKAEVERSQALRQEVQVFLDQCKLRHKRLERQEAQGFTAEEREVLADDLTALL